MFMTLCGFAKECTKRQVHPYSFLEDLDQRGSLRTKEAINNIREVVDGYIRDVAALSFKGGSAEWAEEVSRETCKPRRTHTQ